MEKKKKYCSGCESEQYIWKAHLGDKFCKNCWGKIQSKDPDHKVIPQVSAKRKKLDVEYLKLRTKHMEKFPLCQIKVAGCTNIGTDIHHTYAGSNRDAFYLIQSTWAVTCRNCHNYVHENPAKARTMGWLK
jgi:nitrate/TMAO reductase-like tetraheme cytochrome c subunit